MDDAKGTIITASKHLNAGIGCFSASVILFSCLAGTFGNMLFALTFYGPSYTYVPIWAANSGAMRLLYSLGYQLSGAIPFTGLIFLFHTWPMLTYIPREARKGWYWRTIIGALCYWFIFWALWTQVLGAFGGFEQLMRDTEGNLLDTIGAICLASLVGTLMSLASLLPLGVLQWLVLRRHVAGATRWAITVMATNTVITGVLIGLYCWGTRWGWN